MRSVLHDGDFQLELGLVWQQEGKRIVVLFSLQP
jgi:hypothetical protein